MQKFRANDFYNIISEHKLIQKAIGHGENIADIKINYSNNTLWTNVINRFYTHLHDSIRIVDQENEGYYVDTSEYFKIDASIWKEEAIEEVNASLNYLGLKDTKRKVWDLDVAIEHENNSRDWLYELKQLLCFNVPLKVLITYNDKAFCEEKEFTRNLEKVLNVFSIYHKPKVGEEFLFVFGKSSHAVLHDNTSTSRCKNNHPDILNCAHNGIVEYKFITFTGKLDNCKNMIRYSLIEKIKTLSV